MNKNNHLPMPSVRRSVQRPPTAAPEVIMYPYTEERPVVRGGSNHLHWLVRAFSRADADGTLHDAVFIGVEAEDEGSAIYRAMAILERPYYRVDRVDETCSRDPALKG